MVLSFGTLYGQSNLKQIYGYVVDTAGVNLKGVTVRMTSTSDTAVVTSSSSGYYSFKNVKGANIRVSYSMLGHKIVSKSVSFAENATSLLIPNVILEPQNSFIEDVYVVKTIPVVYTDDTIHYNMDAFKFRQNSLLEEALKQLPGIQVSRDGTVYAQGKAISSVQVDGKKFFDGDVLTATRNLPADFIYKIQVINYYGDFAKDRGIRNEEPEKIINIVLKDDSKRISFGQVTAGGGTRDRFLGSMGINRFNDGQEVSILGSVNNTNTSLFSFGSPSGGGEREKTLVDVIDFVDPTDGLNTVKSLGFNYSDQITPRTQFNTSYSYTRKENVTQGNSILRSNYMWNVIQNSESYQTNSDDNFHKMTAEFKHRFKNNDVLEIKPVFSYNRVYLGNSKDRLINNKRVSTVGTYRDTSLNKNPNLNVDLVYSKAFKKQGRKLLGSVVLNFNSHDKFEDVQDRYVLIDSSTATPKFTRVEQELYVRQNNGTDGVKASISYVEPFSPYSLLEIVYDYELTNMRTLRRVEDKLKSAEKGSLYYVDSLAVHYDYRFMSSRAGLNYQYTPNKMFRANIGFAVQPLVLSGNLPREDLYYEYANVNLVPTAGFKWRLNDEVDWSVDYIGKNNQPNFLHIIPITDNTNLQHIIVGNPELKAEFANRISTMLRKFITAKGQYFETNFAYNFILNKIVSDKKALANSTIQQTTFKNTDGYYDLKWYFLFNTPLFSENLQLDVVGNTDYYNNLAFVNDTRNLTKQFIYSQSMQLRYSWSDYFESVFNANYMLNNATYTWPYRTKITAQSLLLGAATKGYLNDYITLGAEMSQRFNEGYESSFMNNNPTIINAYIEFSFMKNRLALLRFQGYDLLDQNKNMGTYSEYIGNDLYEARNNRLGRYFMVSLNLRLQKYPKKK
ncbi:Carboxypeptidase regulatory-like domain-containing protein [Sphingobacterium psychroaquaticum]|uniref:Carboxypeptidase regulatory-like domain-containing protein n=2 Tax=Sphingobacterium psychroaquaticum TaxID=561061 RepID=A0A1X7I3E0_9SPHI|nr:Carboxypeptidase regulatory-like domain-containing protein [Sphingobacterium psychroaquaticum]